MLEPTVKHCTDHVYSCGRVGEGLRVSKSTVTPQEEQESNNLDPCGLPETEPGVRVGSFPGVPPLLREEGKVKWGKDNV